MGKPYANVSKSNLAIPSKGGASGSYPINTPKRAHAALGLVGMHGTPQEKAEVRAKVHAKYPDIGKKMSAVDKKAKQYGGK